MNWMHDISIGLEWFEKKGWTAFPFQKECWANFLEEKSGLLNAPTGAGKTYALWVPCVLDSIKYDFANQNGLQYLWVTPLRALTRDIQSAMIEFCDDIGLDWKIEIRTGDTSTSQREQQKKKPPKCLITTPESIHVLFANRNAPNFFKNIRGIIVDEWHELLGSKRGVQVELAISRIRNITERKLIIWGISATIGNLEQARKVLLGQRYDSLAVMVKADIEKKLVVESVFPDNVEKFPWQGHLGIKLMPKVIPLIEKSTTTLLFTNTRSQAEIWYREILAHAPHFSGLMAMHHGSVDRQVRLWVEDALHVGKLKLVVCTASLDLGVDFRPVDTVIQVGGPKGIARFVQRAGRSGHRPGEVSKIYFVPTHSLELVEAAALRTAIEHKIVESRKPFQNCIDVLVQYLVTLATGDGFIEDQVYHEVKSTHAYQNLPDEHWEWAMKFITTGGDSLSNYDEFSKVGLFGKVFKTLNNGVAMRHRSSIGTIVGDPELLVRFQNGGYLGTIEENFISRLNPGNKFSFAGQVLEYIRVKDLTVIVKKATSRKGFIPQWGGGRMPLSSHLSDLIKEKIADSGLSDSNPEMQVVKPIFLLQSGVSHVPNKNTLLVEKVQTNMGYHVFMYPFEGRPVHEIMGTLFSERISKIRSISCSIGMNDYGLELLSDKEIPIEQAIADGLFSLDNIFDDVSRSINKSEMSKRRFRDIATIAGMVFQGFPGQKIRSRHIQASSALIYQVLEDYDKENLLLKQSLYEALTYELEQDRLIEAIQKMGEQKTMIKNLEHPSPFSFPILAESIRGRYVSENVVERIEKMQLELEELVRG